MDSNISLDAVLDRLYSQRRLDVKTSELLKNHFYLKYNQQSNAIEGNSLTLTETKVLLENGITAKGKPFKDHLDIINHREAIYYLDDLVKNKIDLSEKIIKEFNYLLIKGTKEEYYAGKYRTQPVILSGSTHIPPQPYMLNALMEGLVADYQQDIEKADDKIARIAKLHSDFVSIHPFLDGNGRTGRLLMNLELLKNGYPLAILSDEKRVEYYQALQQADQNNYQLITNFIKESIKETAIETLNVIDPDWRNKINIG